MMKVFSNSRTRLPLRLIAGLLTILIVIVIRHRYRIRDPVWIGINQERTPS